MPAEKFTTFITPFECKPFHTGTNAKQQEYTIYQVRARNDQGEEIANFPLRSFEKLTLHERIQVEAKLYDGGPQYGVSYTLKPITSGKLTNGERIEKLERQVEYLTAQLASVARAANVATPPLEAWTANQPAAPEQPPSPPSPAPMRAAAPPPAPTAPPPAVQPPPPVPVMPPSQFGDEPPF